MRACVQRSDGDAQQRFGSGSCRPWEGPGHRRGSRWRLVAGVRGTGPAVAPQAQPPRGRRVCPLLTDRGEWQGRVPPPFSVGLRHPTREETTAGGGAVKQPHFCTRTGGPLRSRLTPLAVARALSCHKLVQGFPRASRAGRLTALQPAGPSGETQTLLATVLQCSCGSTGGWY